VTGLTTAPFVQNQRLLCEPVIVWLALPAQAPLAHAGIMPPVAAVLASAHVFAAHADVDHEPDSQTDPISATVYGPHGVPAPSPFTTTSLISWMLASIGFAVAAAKTAAPISVPTSAATFAAVIASAAIDAAVIAPDPH
jgi:hypothetical protein